MRVVVAVLLVVGALAVIGGAWLFAPGPPMVANTVPVAAPPAEPVAPLDKPPAAKRPPLTFKPGDQCRLAHPEGGGFYAATSSLWYPRFVQLLLADDTVGIRKMYIAEQVVIVQSGTRAKVISFNPRGPAEVRIEGDEHDGKALCVMPSCVHRPD